MGLQEAPSFAAPGYSGFVPALKHSFGSTFGTATRHVLEHDPTLKRGRLQQERQRLRQERAASAATAGAPVWKRNEVFATGDDRFSFAPVPGYTGYIPRSKEHFGHSYVETTAESLAEFQHMRACKHELPARVRRIRADHPPRVPESSALIGESSEKRKMGHVPSPPVHDAPPSRLPGRDASRTFPSGYTGFVPRRQNVFGESYSVSVKKAIDEFTAPKHAMHGHHEMATINKTPIPGYTGFIPTASRTIAQTFGRTIVIACDSFNHRDAKGRPAPSPLDAPIAKDLKVCKPIAGYRGLIPGKQDL
ncbi:hypothetical protein SeMB42_g07089 [Synchytrium endobioticum]|nr:hypothetical protein SeMB42_g07089 [Synchytrium endobioticum]